MSSTVNPRDSAWGGRPLGVALQMFAAWIQPMGAAWITTIFVAVGALGALSLRLGFSALILMLLFRPRLPVNAAQWRTVALFAVVMFGMNALFYEAIARMPLGAAVTIEIVGPLTLAAFLERGLLSWLWVFLAAAGVLVLHQGELGHLDGMGSLFALGAGTCWAGYVYFSANAVGQMRGVDGLTWAIFGAALLALPFGISAAPIGRHEILLGAAVAVVSSVIPYSLEQLALRRISPASFAVILSLTPAMATLAGWLVLGQAVGFPALIAVVAVVGASMGSVLTSKRDVAAPVTE